MFLNGGVVQTTINPPLACLWTFLARPYQIPCYLAHTCRPSRFAVDMHTLMLFDCMPLRYSVRRCCEILPSRLAVELHALALLSKILRDSDLGEPLKMSSCILLCHSEKCCKIPIQMNFRKYFWECFHYGCWFEIQCNCLVALKMIILHNLQPYIKCWTLLVIQCNSLMTWK